MRKPFFVKARNCWYVKDEKGKKIRLNPDEGKAFLIWEGMRTLANFKHSDATVSVICEGWLEYFALTATKARQEKANWILSSFVAFQGVNKRMRDVSAVDLDKWLKATRKRGKKEYTWSIARQRDAAQFVLRAYRWAHVQGWIPASDLLLHKCQTPEPRVILIDRETHRRCVMSTRSGRNTGRPFGLLLIALWHSGARPAQIREVTASHVMPSGDWVFSRHKTAKKTGKKLIVRPSPCLQTLTRILMQARPTGALFLFPIKKPWSKDGMIRRFARMRSDLGLDPSLVLYAYRHTFATEAILAGESLPTVAALLGHVDSSMVARVYSHLDICDGPMREAASRIAGRRRG